MTEQEIVALMEERVLEDDILIATVPEVQEWQFLAQQGKRVHAIQAYRAANPGVSLQNALGVVKGYIAWSEAGLNG